MKTTLPLIIIVFSVILAIVFFFINKNINKQPADGSLWENYKIVIKTIEGKKLRLVVADTPERRQKGLMFVRKPVNDFDGMIFIFQNKEPLTFWNMNTYEDLKLYWMDDDTIVGTSDLPSIEKSKEVVTVSSPRPANIVIEEIMIR